MTTPMRLLLPCLIVLAIPATSWAARPPAAHQSAAHPTGPRLYRWVDDQGEVHYTDSLPPGQVERGHAEMSGEGVVVETQGPAKTREEVQQEEELKRAREAADRARKQQEAADQALVRTYRSLDDMIMTRDGKLASIDVMVKLTRSNIRRQQDSLRGLRGDAANLERSGKPIPKPLSVSIAKAEQSIRDAYATMVAREQEKQEVVARFAADMRRFRELKKIPETPQGGEEDVPRTYAKNLIPCPDDATCSRLWETATAYVRKHSSTPVQTADANMVITAAPANPEDISLWLFRIRDAQGTGSRIFLDAQCRPETNNDSTCGGAEAQRIFDGFPDAVLGRAQGG
jgi:hypothetical protein